MPFRKSTRPTEEWLGVGKTALVEIQPCEVVERWCQPPDARARAFSPEIDKSLASSERLGVGKTALGVIEFSEVVERGADIGMVHPERFLAYRQGAFIERFGVGKTALDAIEFSEAV